MHPSALGAVRTCSSREQFIAEGVYGAVPAATTVAAMSVWRCDMGPRVQAADSRSCMWHASAGHNANAESPTLILSYTVSKGEVMLTSRNEPDVESLPRKQCWQLERGNWGGDSVAGERGRGGLCTVGCAAPFNGHRPREGFEGAAGAAQRQTGRRRVPRGVRIRGCFWWGWSNQERAEDLMRTMAKESCVDLGARGQKIRGLLQ